MSCHQQGPARVLQAGVCSQWAGRAAITTSSRLKDFLNYEDVPFSAVLRGLFSQEAVQLFLHTDQEMPAFQVSTEETNQSLEFCSLCNVGMSVNTQLRAAPRPQMNSGSH